MTNKKTTRPTLALHTLLGALSFWGTAARGLLFGFLTMAIFIVALTEVADASDFDNQVMIYIYLIASFLVLEVGYIMIARTYVLRRYVDVLALVAADILLALLYMVPKIVVSPSVSVSVDPLTFAVFVPVIVLSLRMLLGLLFGQHRK